MIGPQPEPGAARHRLAAAQAELLRALVAGAAPPPGFNPSRLRLQADALIAKRREVVARLRPEVAAAAGMHYVAQFDAYARAHPRPSTGAAADADAFAISVAQSQHHETDMARGDIPLLGEAASSWRHISLGVEWIRTRTVARWIPRHCGTRAGRGRPRVR